MSEKRMSGKQLNKTGSAGFSLVEVLVAVAILAILSLPVLSAFASAAKVNNKARRQENANSIGQMIAERCKANSLSELSALAAGTGYPFNKVTSGVSDRTGETVYTFYSAALDGDGNIYDENTSSGDQYFVQVELDPDDYADKTDGSSDNVNNNINSYNMPRFSDVNSKDNFVLMSQIYRNDTTAAAELGVSSNEELYRVVDVYAEITDKDSKGVLNKKTDSAGVLRSVYTQKVRADVTYYIFGQEHTAPSATYSYDLGSCEIYGDVSESTYRNIYLFYVPFDVYREDAGKSVSRDRIIFHVNDGKEGLTENGKFNDSRDAAGNVLTDKTVNFYLVEQETKNVKDSAVSVKLSAGNIQVKIGSEPEITRTELVKSTLNLGSKGLTNLYTNMEQLAVYRPGTGDGKKASDRVNSITQNPDPDVQIKYLYNMIIRIYVNEEPGESSTPFLTLHSTKENVYE